MGFQDYVNVDVRGAAHIAPCTYKTVVLKQNITKQNLNVLTQDMLDEYGKNTKFVVKWNYVLQSNITIPENCVLEFDGGSISGGYTITGANTGIEAGLVKIFNTYVTLAGSWNVSEAYPEWYGAKGDGVTDDTIPLGKTINTFLLTKLSKVYYTTSTILITGDGSMYHSIIGNYNNGVYDFGKLTCGIKSDADTIIKISYDSARFQNVTYKGFFVKGNLNSACGIKVERLNNATFEGLIFLDFKNGTGLDFSISAGFNSQYCIIENCIFSMCQIGLNLKACNGFNICKNYFDGNTNNALVSDYEDGYPQNSVAINSINGDTHSFCGNKIQGYHYGIKIDNTRNCHISHERFEVFGIGIYIISGEGNVVTNTNQFVNWILVQYKQLPDSGRFGVAGYIKGQRNIVENNTYNSCYGFYVENGNIDNTGEVKEIFLGDFKLGQSSGDKTYIRIKLEDFDNTFGCCLKSIECCADNISTFETNVMNFQLVTNGGYIGTNWSGFSAEDGKYYEYIKEKNDIINNSTFFCYFESLKNDSPNIENLWMKFRFKNVVSMASVERIIGN